MHSSLKMSQGAFRMHMDHIMTFCFGIFWIHDHVAVHGGNDAEHVSDLATRVQVPRKKFSSFKCTDCSIGGQQLQSLMGMRFYPT